jgi:hypothetical protein
MPELRKEGTVVDRNDLEKAQNEYLDLTRKNQEGVQKMWQAVQKSATETFQAISSREIPEKFLVAFSFAGEQRDLVRAIAEAVEERLGRSNFFLDEWYEAWIAGSDADILLQDIYNKRCALAVVCVSERYGGKPWTRAEYVAIRARANRARTSASEKERLGVLPIRVGDGDVPGIFLETWIVPDVRPPERSLDKCVELIVNRLQLVAPESHQTAAPPAQPPRRSRRGCDSARRTKTACVWRIGSLAGKARVPSSRRGEGGRPGPKV